ncbi:MAG: hypothetical protein KA164_07275 [Rhodoferax sp.]|nr:hypothetical protein [Rhodoferax sp.]
MSDLLKAVDVLNERLVLADAIGESFEAVGGEVSPPPWVYVYRQQVEAIRAAAEAVEFLVRRGVA